MTYLPTKESLNSHPIPGWFDDAKLGIFIHWGLYSIPAWAPPTGELSKFPGQSGWNEWYRLNPYAEWYANTLKIPGSPTRAHHDATYGADFPYEGFAPLFNGAVEAWNPDAWADLFAATGAGYVVQTTKHHDGFLMWPSAQPNPFKTGWHARRDLVGELAQSVRARGMKMGLYYSGGLDWTFDPTPIDGVSGILTSIPTTQAYADYAQAHWLELIERYQPDVLWNDIGYPVKAKTAQLFAHYYNCIPEGVVNDRFTQYDLGEPRSFKHRVLTALLKLALPGLLKSGKVKANPVTLHADFRTPEYEAYHETVAEKWESCRGLGFSFGYNQVETAEHMLSVGELVRMFVDVVAKNGNLLLDIGPGADGSISTLQRERVEGLARWTQVNGEAVFGTRPWQRAAGRLADGTPLRFTRKGERLYALLMGMPVPGDALIEGLRAQEGTQIHLLGHAAPLEWTQRDGGLAVAMPPLSTAPVYALRITPIPEALQAGQP